MNQSKDIFQEQEDLKEKMLKTIINCMKGGE